MSDGAYSNVPAGDLDLGEEEWRRLSLTIRIEHECTHYFTRRVFSSMHNNVLDELIADYMGIVAADGRYRADWFLRFMGLEDYPHFRGTGRLGIYRGDPPLSDGAFRVLQSLTKRAAENLETWDRSERGRTFDSHVKGRVLMALTRLTLEQLAASMPS